MVLYKRKAVIYQQPLALPENLNTKVWFIPETKEWFYSYDEYLARSDYYMKKKFVCEITGNSCFTYFEALESERLEMLKVEKHFPEQMKEPVLRFLQFSTVPRLDQLVDLVYSKFKNDFYPGEIVLVKFQDTKKPARITEKAKFNSISDDKGVVITPGYCSYRVLFDNNSEVTIDEGSISRDRSHFTKWYVKTFIKLSVSRTSKIGAPWIVRDKFASKYRISTDYPPHLQSFVPSEGSTPKKKTEVRKIAKKTTDKKGAKNTKTPNILNGEVPFFHESNEPKKILLNDLMNNEELREEESKVVYKGPIPPRQAIIAADGVVEHAYLQNFSTYLDLYAPKRSLVEDLDLEPFTYQDMVTEDCTIKDFKDILELQGCISEALESWIFLNVYHNALIIDTFTFDDFVNSFRFKNLKNLDLLNEIFCSVISCFILGEDEDINLRIKGYEYGDEAVEEAEVQEDPEFPVPTDGDYENDEYLLISLPEYPYSDDEEDEEEEVEDEEAEEEEEKTNGHGEEQNGKSIKSEAPEVIEVEKNPEATSKSKDNYGLTIDIYEGITLVKDKNNEEDSEDEYQKQPKDNVNKLLKYRSVGWRERLYKRNFKDGYWQIIVLGILTLVEHMPRYRNIIQEIRLILAPKNLNASPSSIQNQFYNKLSITKKFQMLNILCELLVDGKIIRSYIENAMEESTKLRRDRLDTIREHKAVLDKARDLNTQCLSAMKRTVVKEEDEEPTKKRRRRNYTLRVEPTEEETLMMAENPEFKKQIENRTKLIKEVELLRLKRKKIEKQLVEIDCQRIKLIGKDRLFNRYWWFESNGTPIISNNQSEIDDEEEEEEEEEEDEPKEETYLMGRLWVQGPSPDDSLSLLNTTQKDIENFNIIKENLKYRMDETKSKTELDKSFVIAANEVFDLEFVDGQVKKHGLPIFKQNELLSKLAPIDRKLIEEQNSTLLSSRHWRYVDTVEPYENLIRTLNPWGKRESSLRKNLAGLHADIDSSIMSRRNALKLDNPPEEEAELEKAINEFQINDSTEKEVNFEEHEDEESEEEVRPRTRGTTEEIKEKQIEHDQTNQLKDYRSKIKKLHKLKSEREKNRSLEWVNTSAEYRLGHSHYEGKKKKKTRK